MIEKYLRYQIEIPTRVEMQANGTAFVTTLYMCEKTILPLLILEERHLKILFF